MMSSFGNVSPGFITKKKSDNWKKNVNHQQVFLIFKYLDWIMSLKSKGYALVVIAGRGCIFMYQGSGQLIYFEISCY